VNIPDPVVAQLAAVLGVEPEIEDCLAAATALVDAVVVFYELQETAPGTDDAALFAHGRRLIDAENKLERLVEHRRLPTGEDT